MSAAERDDNLEVSYVETMVTEWMREILQREPNTGPTGAPLFNQEDLGRRGEEPQGDRESQNVRPAGT